MFACYHITPSYRPVVGNPEQTCPHLWNISVTSIVPVQQ